MGESFLNITAEALKLEEILKFDLNLTEDKNEKIGNVTIEINDTISKEPIAKQFNQSSDELTESVKAVQEITIITTKVSTDPPTTTEEDFDYLCDDLPGATGFIEDPHVCNKYIRCNHGKSQRFTCATGTVWDTENKMCLWTESVDCSEREVEIEYEDDDAENGVDTENETDESDSIEKTIKRLTTTTSIIKTTTKLLKIRSKIFFDIKCNFYILNIFNN
jgi:hypothetical protein